MSEEKLYAVKNDEGKYLDCEYEKFLPLSEAYSPTTMVSEDNAKDIVNYYGGHVVVLTEEPEKVVLSKEQAQIVEDAHGYMWPAKYIADNTDGGYESERLLMDAFVNGYTVAKEKKYNVKVPHTDDSYFYKVDDKYCNAGDSYYLKGMTDKKRFTDAEIEHYGLGDCEKVWCDSDDE
ncbi:DUF1642 domain-containing protein [Lacticaseibacillus paracasei subsp. tolerans]|uniref:DUF1642 domain-containing protein n=1 Tax=Lacticaseibacillus paracasei TaxID=1597 RepID=UPI001892C729|nr:DUF1642 domain-containing protein [Lacticaseibacillus paracasei]QPC18894.1 DUF1642 domain-containing protein [Lacticaseibacillus paracasei subsp. tolerans]